MSLLFASVDVGQGMIRILHTIDTTGPGGAETVFLNLVKGLDPMRFESLAAVTGEGWVFNEIRKIGLKPIFLPARGGFNLQYLFGLVKVIRKNRINIVQSHLLGSNLYCSLAGLICGIPVISTFHGFVDSSNHDKLMSVKSQLINLGSKKIVFVSERLRQHFISEYRFSDAKSMTIYNGVDTSVFYPQKNDSIRTELGLGPEHIVLGAVGNIRAAKGYEQFLKAARLINDKHPETRFVIAGEGSGPLYEQLQELRRQLNLEKVFFFLGFRKDSAEVLNNLDLFVLPSISEGFSISTIEAMACGIPVVVTRCGGPEEIVADTNTGIVVDSNEAQIANAVIHLIEDGTLNNKIANFNQMQVVDKFSLAAMIHKYQDIFTS
jgi:glycosyltransferase involved in cell wall biosynthesis